MVIGRAADPGNDPHHAYMKKPIHQQLTLPFAQTIIIFLIMVFVMLDLKSGAMKFQWSEIFAAFQHPESTSIPAIAIMQVRLPMVIIAMLAGSGLAVSGLLLQSVTQNPLACPSLSGIEYATAFSVILCYMLDPEISRAAIMMIALSGGILTYLLVQWIAKRTGASSAGITLIGVAFNSLYYSAIQAILIAFPYQSQAILYDLNGSLIGVTLADIQFIILPYLLLITGVLLLSKRMDLLDMDDAHATALGLNIRKYRSIMLGVAILLSTLITSLVGPLLFFGLAVPHLVRPFARGTQAVWCCAILGALLLLIAAYVTQMLAPQTPPPIGLVMLLMIAPILIVIIQRYRSYDEN